MIFKLAAGKAELTARKAASRAAIRHKETAGLATACNSCNDLT